MYYICLMALLHYLLSSPRGINRNPTGPLSSTIMSPAIKEANAAVQATAEKQGVNKQKRGPYLKLSDNVRPPSTSTLENMGLVRHQDNSRRWKVIEKSISVSMGYDYKKAYCKELSWKGTADKDLTIY